MITRTHSTIRTTAPRILLALLLAATSTAAFAAKSHKSPLPQKPAALLALAAQRNGLTGPNLQPWHIKVRYQLYDTKGNPTEKGTFEEWWAAPNKYTLSFNRANYHMQSVTNAKGTFVTGNDVIPYPEYLVRHIFMDPVTAKLPAKGMKIHINMEKFGKVRLDCVEEIPKGLHPTRFHLFTPTFPTYCMEPTLPMLRVYGSYGQTITEIFSIGTLDGRYLPMDAIVFDNGHKYLSVHLDKGESSAHWSPTLFTARPGAHLETNASNATVKGTKVAAGVVAGYKISGQDPTYPYYAKDHNEQGIVILSALIDQHGNIRNLVVASAPSISLANSALNAVKTWKYKPYLLNGHPVQVLTSIHLIYTLGN